MLEHHTQSVELFRRHFQDRPITGIEIGTGCAVWSQYVLQELENLKKLYTIDPWYAEPGGEYEKIYPQWVLDGNKITAHIRLDKFKDRVKILVMSSDEAIGIFKEPVDFVWIDGNHKEFQVERDIRNYMPLVKEGGIMGGHDYHIIKSVLQNIFGFVNVGDDLTWWVYL